MRIVYFNQLNIPWAHISKLYIILISILWCAWFEEKKERREKNIKINE
jgi:hypothetical protein